MWGCGAGAKSTAEFHLRKVASDAQGGGDSAISPDGTRFVTSLQRSGNWDLWIYDLRVNQWSQVTTDSTDEFEAKWSPDAQSLVFTSTRKGNKDIFLIDLKTKVTRQLTDDPEDDEYPVFSPDGKTIAFTGGPWKERNFYLVDLNGKNRRAISKTASQAGACSFHPSGESLVCHSYDSGTGNVYLYPVGGGDRLRITNGRFWDYKPAISPNGKWLAFSRSQEGPSAIYVMPFPVGEARPLTDPNGDDRWPTWSASGEQILFHRLVNRGLAVEILDRDTGKVERAIDSAELPGPASMDPTGKFIVYAAGHGSQEKLRIKNLETGATVTLPLNVPASFPRWSPDGKHIAFAIRQAERWDVATARPDGGDLKVWTASIENLRGVRSALDWSPDSTGVVFHASEVPFEANLYLVNVRTGKLKNLTNDHWYSEAPSFSPDGTQIAFMSTRGGNWTWGIFSLHLQDNTVDTVAGPDYVEKNFPRMNRDGSFVWSEYTPAGREFISERTPAAKPRQRLEAGSWARWPSYSPDGKKIVYTKLDHQVEYWVAENVTGMHSPLFGLHPPESKPSLTSSMLPLSAGVPEPNRSAQRSSPVQMHHR